MGVVLTLTLVGDVVVSLYLTTRADRIGRRRMLIIGSILTAAAGLAFACTSNLLFLVIAGRVVRPLTTPIIGTQTVPGKRPGSAPMAGWYGRNPV